MYGNYLLCRKRPPTKRQNFLGTTYSLKVIILIDNGPHINFVAVWCYGGKGKVDVGVFAHVNIANIDGLTFSRNSIALEVTNAHKRGRR